MQNHLLFIGVVEYLIVDEDDYLFEDTKVLAIIIMVVTYLFKMIKFEV